MMSLSVDQLVLVKDTIDLIRILHHGQTDWTGTPYWMHPVAVMEGLPPDSSLTRILMALLHDVAEDCAEKIAELTDVSIKDVTTEYALCFLASKGYSQDVLDGVRLVTRDKNNVTYLDYVRNIVASGNLDAMWVKLSDNTHNSDPMRISLLSKADQMKLKQMCVRYEKSKSILRQGIAELVC